MVEAGVPYIVINYPGGWDTHKDHFADHAPAVPAAGPGPGHAAAGPEGSRPAGQHARLVLRRVRPRRRRSTGSRRGTAAATITATSSPCWSPAAASRAATSSAPPTPRRKRSRTARCIRWTCSGSIYQLAGIDPNAKLPHPMGQDAHVLPVRRGRREVGRAADRDHVAALLCADRALRLSTGCGEGAALVAGVRPFSGAATSTRGGGSESSNAPGGSWPAAPEDGRTPEEQPFAALRPQRNSHALVSDSVLGLLAPAHAAVPRPATAVYRVCLSGGRAAGDQVFSQARRAESGRRQRGAGHRHGRFRQGRRVLSADRSPGDHAAE